MSQSGEIEPPRHGLVLVPAAEARIQDLGPYRTGARMETDILPHSALVCASDDGDFRLEPDGTVHFTFEGNANGAVNLERYYERCIAAAGRLATGAASIAQGHARPEHLAVVARIDLLNFVFTEITDAERLEAWAGERLADFLPPKDLPTPTTDATILAALTKLPMRILAHGEKGIHVWQLYDGTLLTLEDGSRSLTAWRRGDEGLRTILSRAGVSVVKCITMGS